jgi:Mn2+/Fe2+ NRAMP family transporter
VITGASDDDASRASRTCSQTGAAFGYGLLWLALGTLLLMIAVQEMCARSGMTSGCGLAETMKRRFSSRTVAVLCLLLFTLGILGIGLLAPFLLFFIIRLADDPRVVGQHRSPGPARVIAWVTLGFMAVAGAVLIAQQFRGWSLPAQEAG